MIRGSGVEIRHGAVGVREASALSRFAAQLPLQYADFASLARMQPPEPGVWTCWRGRDVVAAAIDDGMAMSVGGDPEALATLAGAVPDLADKLVVAGRTPEVEAFVADAGSGRRMRIEHFMAVSREQLRAEPEQLPLRVAVEDDLPLLERVRVRAIEEEYGIPVPDGSPLHRELVRSVRRAISMQGVAIWTEEGRVAFTAQLIATSPEASMFGDLYTDPELRGAGRATRGLTAFCVWLMSECTHVTLRVGVENEPAVRLYERVGFSVIDSFCSSLRDDAGVPG